MAKAAMADTRMVAKQQQSASSSQQEVNNLKKLLKIISTKDQKWYQDQKSKGVDQAEAAAHDEVELVKQFCLTYDSEREFSKHKQAKLFSALFAAVLKSRITNSWWTDKTPPENILRILKLIRLLLRDPVYQKDLISLDKVTVLAVQLNKWTESYMSNVERPFVVDIIVELIYIFFKLLSQDGVSEHMITHGVHESLVKLLSSTDLPILHHAIRTLNDLVQSPSACKLVSEFDCVDPLLLIIQEYDDFTKTLAADLLRYLCSDPQTKEMVKICDGIPVLLSALQSNSLKLLKYTVWCLVQLSEDPDVKDIMRRRGGLPLLLGFLGEKKVKDEEGNQDGAKTTASNEHYLALKSACCACLTELILNDTNAQQIVQSNGIYCIGRLILPGKGPGSVLLATNLLQKHAFRTLRFLFSMEKNRQLFKHVFPPTLFEKFIDVGSYNKDINDYSILVDIINKLSPEMITEIEEKLESTNHNREVTRTVNEYSVLELLGAGSYGSVYKVRKMTSESLFAMKEINTQNAMWGASSKERQKSVGDVINELTIIREQLKHPNVVRYYKTFKEHDHLYIVMELIEGVALGEHFSSLKEKNAKFSEDRVWHIFVQLVLALRYLHKEKRIVHRDLTPNNIMLGEGDRVTITDFGLAKVKQAGCSKMMSQVGTMLYWGPELILNKPYGEKADIWAIGCILYQMCTLNPPFYSNILSLAVKIVNAEYEPIPENLYSEKVISTVKRCMTVDVEKRPDIIGVASHISDILLLHMDQVKRQHAQLERKLEHERNRSRMHKSASGHFALHHQQLCLVSQECCDKQTKMPNCSESASVREPGLADDSVLCSPEINHTKMIPNAEIALSSRVSEEVGRNSEENDWGTDEEQCSSCSESNSRASSAGHGGVTEAGQGQSVRHQQRIAESLAQQLTLEIPAVKYSRDSGISSGDPSPNAMSSMDYVAMDTVSEGINTPNRPRSYQPGLGSPTLESIGRRALRSRPSSATLAISQRKVREINDPILQILHQLHKIIYITQLPPTLKPSTCRRIIDRYKRALFAPRSTPMKLKHEMRKLITGSRDVIDVDLGRIPAHSPNSKSQSPQEPKLGSPSEEQSGYDYMESAGDIGITYEQMQNIIERVLVENGYYDFTCQDRRRTAPARTLRSLSMPYHS